MKSKLKITLVNPKPELVVPSCGPLSLLDIYVVQLKMSPLVLTWAPLDKTRVTERAARMSPSLFPVHRSAEAKSHPVRQMDKCRPHMLLPVQVSRIATMPETHVPSHKQRLWAKCRISKKGKHMTQHLNASSCHPAQAKLIPPQDRAKSRRWALNITQDDSSVLPKILLQVGQITPNSARLRGCLLVHVKQFASKAVQLCSSFFPSNCVSQVAVL